MSLMIEHKRNIWSNGVLKCPQQNTKAMEQDLRKIVLPSLTLDRRRLAQELSKTTS